MESSSWLSKLRPEQRETVERGEPLVCPDPTAADEQSAPILGFVLLQQRPEVLWEFCCDWGNMNKLVPAIRYDVLERGRSGAIERLSLQTEARLGLLKMHFISQAEFDHEARTQTWRLASPQEIAALRGRGREIPDNSGFVRAVRGRARFVEQGGHCLLVYENEFTPATKLPKPIKDFMTRRGLHSYLQAFAKWFAPHDRSLSETDTVLSS